MCPRCSSDATEVIESRKVSNGSRRRRHKCHICDFRWTTYDGPPPGHRGGLSKGQRVARPPELTPDEVRMILLSVESTRTLGRQLGRSAEAIRQVRAGLIHQQVHPTLERTQRTQQLTRSPTKSLLSEGPSCHLCQHWADRCTFGYPDPIEEGPGFASDCSMYEP